MDQETIEAIETLKAAKEQLFEKGWVKGTLGPSEGPNCMVGAIRQVNGYDLNANANKMHNFYRNDLAIRTLSELIDINITKIPAFQVEYFNDQKETSFDDVVNAFDRAIKNLEMG